MDRYLRALAITALVLVAASIVFAQTASAPKRLAVVNGEPVTEEEVQKAAAGDFDNLELRRSQFEATYRQDRQTILEKSLNNAIDEKVIAAEAKKRNLTVQALMTSDVQNKVVAPTDKDVTTFFEANKSRIGATGDEALRQVREYLTQQEREKVYDAFIAKLRKDYNVEMLLEPLRVQVATQGHPTLGAATAPVTIVEFSDFECPYCGQLFPTLKQIEADYGSRVRVVFRQFPLTSLHPHAQKAAEAALCANDQQKFWELHDAMFKDAKNLEVDALKQKATALNLDMTAFNACIDTARHAETIMKDIRDGVKAGVTGTPAMFINGRFLNGVQPYAEISKVIDEELKKNQAKQ